MKSTLKTIKVAGFLLLTTVAFASCGGNEDHDHDHDHEGHEHHEGDHDDH
jgi:hypothetical protein